MAERKPRRRLRRLIIVLAVLGAIVAGLSAASAPLQRSMMYFPDSSHPGAAADAVQGASDVVLRTADGLELDAWLIAPSEPDRGVAVLMASGNGGNRGGRAELAAHIAERGFTVLLIDYRGYGGNPGSPSEPGLAADARAAANYLSDQGFSPQCQIYYGESLGTGVVAGLAVTNPPAGLVLRSPFTSFVDVAKLRYPWLPADAILVDRYPLVEQLANSQTPVVVLAGSADELIPVAMSQEVADGVGNLHRLHIVQGAMHNDGVWYRGWIGDEIAALADEVTGDCG